MIHLPGTWISFCCKSKLSQQKFKLFLKSLKPLTTSFSLWIMRNAHLVDFHCFSVRTTVLFWCHCAAFPVKTSSAEHNRFLVAPEYCLFSLGSVILVYRSFEIRFLFSAKYCFAWGGTVVETEIRRFSFHTCAHSSHSLYKLAAGLTDCKSEAQDRRPIPVLLAECYFVRWLQTNGIYALFWIVPGNQTPTLVVLQAMIKYRIF